MNDEQLKKGVDLQAILSQLKRHRKVIAESNSFAIGTPESTNGSISCEDSGPYLGTHPKPLFFKNVEKITDPGLQVAFSAFKAMLLSIYDQKIAEKEKEFADL